MTREAIDERLRALENVQGTVWRCVEELVRVRSVLPARRETPSSSQAQEPVPSNESSTEKPGNVLNDKGKAKATIAEDVGEAPIPNSPAAVSDPVVPAALEVDLPAMENEVPALIAEVEGVTEPAQ